MLGRILWFAAGASAGSLYTLHSRDSRITADGFAWGLYQPAGIIGGIVGAIFGPRVL